jgi:mono/diheme cytochrome c family protein
MKYTLLRLAAALALLVVGAQRSFAQDSVVKTLYDENCKKCHGVRGTPPKAMKTKFEKIATFDAAFVEKHSVDSIAKVLAKGKNEDMKSFKDKLTPAQMTAVAQYVHDLALKKDAKAP